MKCCSTARVRSPSRLWVWRSNAGWRVCGRIGGARREGGRDPDADRSLRAGGAPARDPSTHQRKWLGKQPAGRADQIKVVVQDYAASYAKAGGGRTLVLPVPRQAAEVESLVLEDNVVQWVLSQVKVEDKAADFDELMGNAKSKS